MFFSLVLAILACFLLNVVTGAVIKERGYKCDRKVDLAIVGAGPTGTYSAYKLRDAGLSIELFEFSNRIGGRLFTKTFPGVPDVNLELGGMRFFKGQHVLLEQLLKELGLTVIDFPLGYGAVPTTKFFLKGQLYTYDEIKRGNVPYNLSLKEKENQHRLDEYYFEKAVGPGISLTEEDPLKLKTTDGRELYKMTIDELFDLVATPEGLHFLKDSGAFDGFLNNNVSALDYLYEMYYKQPGTTVMTVKEGMSSVPNAMAKVFLASSYNHKISLNKQLEEISENKKGLYQLHLRNTATVDGLTKPKSTTDTVCAKRVILGLPQFALTQIKWTPFSLTDTQHALHAVSPIKASKVFMAFKDAWWLTNNASESLSIITEESFNIMYNWKYSNVSGLYVLLASYADGTTAAHLEQINARCDRPQCPPVGPNVATKNLIDELVLHIGRAVGVAKKDIPDPVDSVAQFWTSYPFGGGWTSWNAGYTGIESQTIKRPSLEDDVFIVGSDFAPFGTPPWVESGLQSVEQVFAKYLS